MAGYYPDVPGNRFAYHVDGSTILLKDGANTLYDITSSSASLNDEDLSNGLSVDSRNSLILVFPQLRNLQGYFISYTAGNYGGSYDMTSQSLQSSVDTTNGLDGTWSTVVNPWTLHINKMSPEYRQNISSAAASGIKGLRFNFTDNGNTWHEFRGVHLYGSIPVTQTPDRLIFWESLNDNETPAAYFDWGDIPRSTAQTKQFRIKNNSATQTANSITISAGAQTYTMALELSVDNVSFSSSVNIGNLGPGVVSSTLYVRRTIPADEPLRAQAIRLSAVAASWS